MDHYRRNATWFSCALMGIAAAVTAITPKAAEPERSAASVMEPAAWQTWPDPTMALPIGEPRLMVSAAKDGDVQKELVQKRDSYYGIDVNAIRKQREKLLD